MKLIDQVGLAYLWTKLKTLFAPISHEHPPQTSVAGNAGTASKLLTPRKITLTGDIKGSAQFDGSGDISIQTTSEITVPQNVILYELIEGGDT